MTIPRCNRLSKQKLIHHFCFANKFIYKDMCSIIETNKVHINQSKLIMQNKSISIHCYNFVLTIKKVTLKI